MENQSVRTILFTLLITTSCATDDADKGTRRADDECDPVAQDCADPTERCILVEDPVGSSETHTTCAEVQGSQGEHDPCERIDGLGIDTCEPGLVCVFWEMPWADPWDRQCLPYCLSDGDCASGEHCHSIGVDPWAGACTLTCDVFGDDCGSDQGCRWVESFDSEWTPMCQPAGAGLWRDACESSTECGPGMSCVLFGGYGECRDYCDDDHPCDDGYCREFGNIEGRFYCEVG